MIFAITLIFFLTILGWTNCDLTVDFQANKQLAIDFLASGGCEHVLIDLGSNRGLQIRKLFEPHYYSNSKLVDFYKNFFGQNVTGVCAFGFEANPRWTHRLKLIAETYRSANLKTVIFTRTAAGTEEKLVTFHAEEHHERIHKVTGKKYLHRSTIGSGSSLINPNHSGIVSVNATMMDIPNFFVNSVMTRKNPLGKNSKVLLLMDIEGSEFTIMETLWQKNKALCHFTAIMCEYHATKERMALGETFLGGNATVSNFQTVIKDLVNKEKSNGSCDVQIVEDDDESEESKDDTANPLLSKKSS